MVLPAKRSMTLEDFLASYSSEELTEAVNAEVYASQQYNNARYALDQAQERLVEAEEELKRVVKEIAEAEGVVVEAIDLLGKSEVPDA